MLNFMYCMTCRKWALETISRVGREIRTAVWCKLCSGSEGFSFFPCLMILITICSH